MSGRIHYVTNLQVIKREVNSLSLCYRKVVDALPIHVKDSHNAPNCVLDEGHKQIMRSIFRLDVHDTHDLVKVFIAVFSG